MKTTKKPSKKVAYPYIPKGRSIKYVSPEHKHMRAARKAAKDSSLDGAMPTGSVVVINDVIVGKGANGSDYHTNNVCERVRLKIPTGQGYELCEGCHPKNHSEPKAIAHAKLNHSDLSGAALYLWGHWWCCEPCWQAITENGITTVYLLEDSEILFNKEHPKNVVGRQFTY